MLVAMEFSVFSDLFPELSMVSMPRAMAGGSQGCFGWWQGWEFVLHQGRSQDPAQHSKQINDTSDFCPARC